MNRIPVVDITEACALHGGERPRSGERALAHPDGVPPLEALLLPRARLGAPAEADEDDEQRHGHDGDQRVDHLQRELCHGAGEGRQPHVLVHLAERGQHEVAADALDGAVHEDVAASAVEVVYPHHVVVAPVVLLIKKM